MIQPRCALVLILTATASASAHTTQPTGEEVVQVSKLLGFTPEALAAIDVRDGEVSTLLDRISEEYDQYQSWLAADQARAEALCDARAARAALRVNPDDQEAQSLLSQSVSQAQSALASMGQIRDTLFSELLDGLADTSAVPQVIHTNNESVSLPPEYRLAVNTAQGAKTLHWALKLEDRIERIDDPEIELPQAASNAISTAVAQADFQLARARVQAHAAIIQTAIDQWALNH